MCEPLTIASLAATVAGTGAQIAGQRKAQKAVAAARRAEMDRQEGYEREAAGYWSKALDRSATPAENARLEEASQKRGAAYSGAVKDFNPNTDLLSGQGSAPAVVQNNIQGELTSAIDAQRLEGLRKALLDAWGDSQLGGAIDRTRGSEGIGMTGGFARRSADVLPTELEAAQMKGAGLRTLGGAMQALGMVGGMAAGGGGGFGELFGSAAPTRISEAAAKSGIGPWNYTRAIPGMPGSEIFSRALPALP